MQSNYIQIMLLVAALVGAAGTGFGLGRRGPSRMPEAKVTIETETIEEPVVDEEIAQAAADWAAAYGRPEMAQLLASKVRLAWRLSQEKGSAEREGRV